jgi:hypothetical protein
MFDGVGLGAGVLEACFANSTIVIGPSSAIADVLIDMIKYADIDVAYCLSTDLEELARMPDVLAKLTRLKFIRYFGGM